jgi:hypothetical protein
VVDNKSENGNNESSMINEPIKTEPESEFNANKEWEAQHTKTQDETGNKTSMVHEPNKTVPESEFNATEGLKSQNEATNEIPKLDSLQNENTDNDRSTQYLSSKTVSNSVPQNETNQGAAKLKAQLNEVNDIEIKKVFLKAITLDYIN